MLIIFEFSSLPRMLIYRFSPRKSFTWRMLSPFRALRGSQEISEYDRSFHLTRKRGSKERQSKSRTCYIEFLAIEVVFYPYKCIRLR